MQTVRRSTRFSSMLAAGVSLLVFCAGVAQAQTPAGSVADEIVVTARQRSEQLIDTPLSVSAFSAETIAKAGIERPEDFIALTPNVSFIQTTNVGESQVHIRGVIQPRDSEPPFAYVVDGVLVPNPNAFNQELVDLRQIEVIKGPIGSIYGRNAIGGAILVTTQKPSDEVEGALKVGYEFEGQEASVSGFLSGPIVANKLAGRLTFSSVDREGYFDNITLRQKEDPFTEQSVRGRLVWTISPDLELDTSLGWAEIDGHAFNFNNQTAGTFGFGGGVNTGDTSIPFAGNVRSFNNQERLDFSSKLTWTGEFGEVKLTAAYHDLTEDMGGEGAVDLALIGILPGPSFADFATNPALFEGYGPTPRDGTQYQQRNQDDTSFEVRWTSPGEDRLRWILGAYYIDFNREIVLNRGVDTGLGQIVRAPIAGAASVNPTVAVTWTDNANDAWAVFGQLAYDITPKLEASLALRYDEENRESRNLTPAAFSPVPGDAGRVRSASFDAVQPRLSLRYKPNDDLSIYAVYGEGFRSGGFNPLGSRFNIINVDGVTNTTVQDDFSKESSRSYEAGLKTRLMDGRASFNAAAFFTQVEDAHFFQFFSVLPVARHLDRQRERGARA